MGTFNSIEEILKFARKLEDSTISDQKVAYRTNSIKTASSKGGFGQYLENAYFGLETNSMSLPDFYPLPLELKATPLKYDSKNKLIPKERLVLNIINYNETGYEYSINSSHFLEKNAKILIVWYIHASAPTYADTKINLVDIWECLEEDRNQIVQDWNTIVNKIKAGKAHELTESDTLYLGACTKGENSKKSYRSQPFSDIKAKQRAFCFKTQYMKTIYQRMLDKKTRRRKSLARFCSEGETVQEKALSLINQYLGKSVSELKDLFGIGGSKGENSIIIRHILGAGNHKPEKLFHEFAASDIQIKTIKVDKNGKNKESMSFPAIQYQEIIDETWEDSTLYSQLIRKFLCPIFVYKASLDDYVLDRCTIWNMPESDLDKVHIVWEDTKNKIAAGDYEHFMQSSDSPVAHIRPHGKDSDDKMETPQGTMEGKKSFWLNASYVFDNIVNK